jgi:hypothetical protein
VIDLLHAGALAPALVSVCCVAADRRRARAREVGASVLMLTAMVDASLTQFVAPILWAGLLIVAGMGMAATHRRRPVTAAPRGVHPATIVHTELGMVLMAVLLVTMSSTHASTAHSHHGLSAAGLNMVVAGAGLGYAAWSAHAARRAAGRLASAQFAAMGLSVLVMAAAATA